MNKINKNNKKNAAAKAAKEYKNNLIGLLREDCQNLVEVAKTERDEDGKLLTYEDKAIKAKFFMAYKKAKLHFGELAKIGEEGKKIAHVIFGREAHECVEFRCTEKAYLKKHPEDKGFFSNLDYYDYTRKKSPEEKIQNKIAAKNANEAKKIKAVRDTGRRNRRVIAIAIVILIAVAAFAVAVYKKGFKTAVKAVAFGAIVTAVVVAFKKAQDAVLERIKNKFYGNK